MEELIVLTLRKFQFLEMPNPRFLALIQGAMGGLMGGLALSQSGVIFLFPSLILLWPASRFPLAASLWGGIAALISHRWLLALHPLTWLGIPFLISLIITFLIWFVCGVLAALLVGIWAFIGNKFIFYLGQFDYPREKFFYALFMACLWGLAEVSLARLPLFWTGLGASLLPGDRAIAGLARWVGGGGLAAIQLIIGWWIWQIINNFRRGFPWRRGFIVGCVLLFLSHIIGLHLLQPIRSKQSVPIAAWQPSVPTRIKFSEEQQLSLPGSLDNALKSSSESGASFLVAPEGTLFIGQSLIAPAPIPLLSGGFRWVEGQQRSSLLVIERGQDLPSGGLDKYRLVPLGEWIPSVPGGRWLGLSAVGGIQAGSSSRLLKWSGPTAAVAICYELSNGIALSKAVYEGAEWILTIANLDPYPILLQNQFLSLAQLRSIETGRDTLSVGNTGPSSIISGQGIVREIISPFQEGIGFGELHLSDELTGYLRWKELPLFLSIAIGILGFLWLGRL